MLTFLIKFAVSFLIILLSVGVVFFISEVYKKAIKFLSRYINDITAEIIINALIFAVLITIAWIQ